MGDSEREWDSTEDSNQRCRRARHLSSLGSEVDDGNDSPHHRSHRRRRGGQRARSPQEHRHGRLPAAPVGLGLPRLALNRLRSLQLLLVQLLQRPCLLAGTSAYQTLDGFLVS